jgi:hypothetical protein
MPTHEFTFRGGRATITTETGGTDDHPDFCVEYGDAEQPFLLVADPIGNPVPSILAAEILRLSGDGMPLHRLEFILSRLAEIFPLAVSPASSRPPELVYLRLIESMAGGGAHKSEGESAADFRVGWTLE